MTDTKADTVKQRKALPVVSGFEGLARAEAARERLDTLERERAEATLKGDAFDHAKVRDARDEVEAIDAAQAEATRREREADAGAKRVRKAVLRKQVTTWDTERRSAIEEAEALARAMAEALARAEAHRQDIMQALKTLGVRAFYPLSGTQQFKRLSFGLSTVLNGSRLANIRVEKFVAPVTKDDAWMKAEDEPSAQLASILEKSHDE